MDFFHHTVILLRLVGIAPVEKNSTKQGVEYRCSRRALVVLFLQLLAVVWMMVHFRYYMTLKAYYSNLRAFQVSFLMYCEVGQSLGTLLCTLLIRLPQITDFLGRCVRVIRDLEGREVPLAVRLGPVVSLLIHTLITLYRTKDSSTRNTLLIPFWAGMTQVVMAHGFLFVVLTLVKMSHSRVNLDLKVLLARRPHEDRQFVVRRLHGIRQRQARSVDLFSSCRSIFGPDVFMLCFFFLFKVSFICYHIYYRHDSRLWGQNTLVGELTGYFLIAHLLLSTSCLAYASDAVTHESAEALMLLLTLLKERKEGFDSEIKNTIKAFILQIKSQSHTFSVCGHFVLSRCLVYDMALGAVTYVFILIQFQGIKS